MVHRVIGEERVPIYQIRSRKIVPQITWEASARKGLFSRVFVVREGETRTQVRGLLPETTAASAYGSRIPCIRRRVSTTPRARRYTTKTIVVFFIR